MSLTTEEKGIVEEALSVYLQLLSQQAPPQQVQQLAHIAQGIIKKLDSAGNASNPDGGNKPSGITDEWYDNVCVKCNKLSPGGCSDKVTDKFPGKCDPILHFERQKSCK